MVRIHHADLPGCLYAHAATRGRRTVIYLRPGLTATQRRESLRRTLHTARMGFGPSLSARDVAFALAVHRVRSGLSSAVSAVCRHPMMALLLVGGLPGMACVCMLIAVA